jgi:hypothetical protein
MTSGGPVEPDLAAGLPDWAVWVNGSGRWWAIYKAVLSSRQIAAGCLPLIVADDRTALAARICEQEALRTQFHP